MVRTAVAGIGSIRSGFFLRWRDAGADPKRALGSPTDDDRNATGSGRRDHRLKS
jgi:hypothetical protein